MTAEMWLALISLLGSGGAAIWVVMRVIIPKLVLAQLEAARDRREHQQTLETTEAQSVAHYREGNQKLTLTLNQNIIGTLERSMAESTTANEALRDLFFNRLDSGLNHIYSELDGIRLEMRRADANYNDLAKEQHLYVAENQNSLEERLNYLTEIVGRLVVLLQATHQIELRLPGEAGEQGAEEQEG